MKDKVQVVQEWLKSSMNSIEKLAAPNVERSGTSARAIDEESAESGSTLQTFEGTMKTLDGPSLQSLCIVTSSGLHVHHPLV